MLLNYQPQPIDTTDVEISDCLLQLVETLARNAHEIWAQRRMQDGWTYGHTRDDARKLHPCLVRFEEMSEADKSHDRAMMIGILKGMIASGIRIICD